MGKIHDLSPNGINSIGWQAEVNTFADLPLAEDNLGKTYMVLTSTGLLITFNLKRSGLYYSDGVTWEKKSNVQSMFADDALTFQDDVDPTKQIGFQLSSIGTGIRRIFEWPNKNGIVAMLSDITGGSGGTDSGLFGDIISSGAASSGYTVVGSFMNTNSLVYFIDGANPGVTKTWYVKFIVPKNYIGGGKFNYKVAKSAALTLLTSTAYINDVVDTTIDALNIEPTTITTWETKVLTFGTTLLPGKSVMMQVNFTGSNGEDVEFDDFWFDFD